MPILTRRRAAHGLAAVALIGVALALTACVSDSAGSAFGTPTATPIGAAPTAVPAATMAQIPRDQPAAIVDGTPISGAQYADVVAQQRTIAALQQQQNPTGTPPTEKQLRIFSIDSLIERKIVNLWGQAHGLVVTPAQVEARYLSFQTQFGGPITFTNALTRYGFTVLTYKALLHDDLLRTKVANIVAPLPASVPQVRARHILVKTKALADRLYAQLVRDPGQFAALAKKYSIDTGSGASGGELGYFGRGQMVPPFEQAAFTQPVGQIGKPVHSQFGYHIIQVEAHRNLPFAQLDSTTQQTYQTRQNTQFAAWIKVQRTKYHVRVLATGLGPGA